MVVRYASLRSNVELPCEIKEFKDNAWKEHMTSGGLHDDDDENSSDEEEEIPDSKSSRQTKAKISIDSLSLNNYVRGKVSKKKRRYQQDDFDLDLSYITPKVIAMGYPADGVAGSYRNNYVDVQKFFNQKHPGRYYFYNLCSEQNYVPNRFENRVVWFPFDDHNPCGISRVHTLLEHMALWHKAHEDNMIAVHCKAGKGRTGFILSCYLLFQADPATGGNSPEEALSYFAVQRTYNEKVSHTPHVHHISALSSLLLSFSLSLSLSLFVLIWAVND